MERQNAMRQRIDICLSVWHSTIVWYDADTSTFHQSFFTRAICIEKYTWYFIRNGNFIWHGFETFTVFNSLNVGMEWNEMKWNEQVFELLYNFYILLNSSLRQHVDLKTPLLHFNFARKIVWSAFQTAGLIQFISSQAKFQPTMNEQNNMYAFKAWQQSYCNRSSSSYAL